jgi:redox-sensitive bicupin YhaK (pirin superfamily)
VTRSILEAQPLGFPWATQDPFLFCVFHDDAYPRGNAELGPAAALTGRKLGQDFEGIDGWRMYHGQTVPGFPAHPHRGFETVTIVRRGFIDHSDSLGATARFGEGDVQWLTAGGGIVHAEMFPLLRPDAPNPLELFQIWLNLPSSEKLCEPHFSMLWSEHVPLLREVDSQGRETQIRVITGSLGPLPPPAPPPHSWASRSEADLAIWTIRLAPGAEWTLPRAEGPATRRTLYFFRGRQLRIDGTEVPPAHALVVAPHLDLRLEAGADECELLLLQGRPIGEPVVQYGPFVMNTREEIHQAFADYQRTRFGGWPWSSDAPVHGREASRFARHTDGREERPGR